MRSPREGKRIRIALPLSLSSVWRQFLDSQRNNGAQDLTDVKRWKSEYETEMPGSGGVQLWKEG